MPHVLPSRFLPSTKKHRGKDTTGNFFPEMKNSPSICQWYLSSLLSPVLAAVGEAIILHYMDDVLLCAPNDDLLSHVLDLTVDSLVAAGSELQEEKIQRMPPWKYLGLEIGERTIVPQKLAIKNNIRTLAEVQQLCGSLNWILQALQGHTEVTPKLLLSRLNNPNSQIYDSGGAHVSGAFIPKTYQRFMLVDLKEES
ncbi:hypothetical protein DUI87_22198 [Hirundo rustica rustica]|uniref:ribonuclease H n=1 Tax=Hirundo rustica rustica TaxID=333673 RepID=A0A3M0JKA0_HIRRU|nr:hypothetical protein DUI87_22198 [Hirundo rustica rustica]